ncbi:MAG TPA: hypothetical protein PK200_13025 [Spirochaetota bacterium]|nr:hypothetical protein [Spirochaetota bacterium]HQO01546.1 hypothetical protein [Spirochaetota bacterium]
MKIRLRVLCVLLCVPFLGVCGGFRLDPDQYEENLLGRWQMVGDHCNEAGSCKKVIDGDKYTYMKNGIIHTETKKYGEFSFEYDLRNDTIYFYVRKYYGSRPFPFTILYMTRNEMLLFDVVQRKNKQAAYTKYAKIP